MWMDLFWGVVAVVAVFVVAAYCMWQRHRPEDE